MEVSLSSHSQGCCGCGALLSEKTAARDVTSGGRGEVSPSAREYLVLQGHPKEKGTDHWRGQPQLYQHDTIRNPKKREEIRLPGKNPGQRGKYI